MVKQLFLLLFILGIIGITTYPVSVEEEMVFLHPEGEGEQEKELVFKVVSNRNVATFIKELTLEPANGKAFRFKPGEYIQMEIPPYEIRLSDLPCEPRYEKAWKKSGLKDCFAKNSIYQKRNFSMAVNPEKEKQLKFNVRISLPPENDRSISAGVGSSYVFNLQPGDEVKLTGPFGDFHIKDSEREMVYLGGGAGMAPLRSHLSYLFETLKTKRKVSYWYGARSLNDVFYRDYFEEMQRKNDHFSYHLALSKNVDSEKWNGHVGFIHQFLLDEYLKNHPNPAEVEYYLCGPPAMIKAGLEMLKELNVPKDMIAHDEF